MSTTEAAFGGAFLGASLMVGLALVIAYYVFYVIAFWKIFNKMGEPGWKSLIPFYNLYTMFKHVWETKWFWSMLIFMFAGNVLMYGNDGTIIYTVGAIIDLVGIVFFLMSYFYLCKSFGKGVGFFILMILFEFIVTLVLGFGSSRYLGNAGKKEV